ncbi:hypothetical protein Ciccas_001090 [Cichlidogyrus casuarinus]|uniref:Uncharacterized protein n=1 Tax=Cichlidogyrus casuarinus TaxID=1844966 RepID=A0ABD2QLI2_9PLAT
MGGLTPAFFIRVLCCRIVEVLEDGTKPLNHFFEMKNFADKKKNGEMSIGVRGIRVCAAFEYFYLLYDFLLTRVENIDGSFQSYSVNMSTKSLDSDSTESSLKSWFFFVGWLLWWIR